MKNWIVRMCCMLLLGLAASALMLTRSQAQEPKPDPWAPVRFLEGAWEGSSEGESGKGAVSRSYEFVLKSRYLHERNTSTYAAQEANKAGEVHEHWGFFSYDRTRASLVFRQFHQEGFVNQYVFNSGLSTAQKLVFDSEHFENFDNSWKARETYEVVSPDEFVETFELGAPGAELQVYSRNHFKRVKP